MKLRFKDLGERRWLCYASAPSRQLSEFKRWLDDNLADRSLVTALGSKVDVNTDEYVYEFEIRGGDVNDRILLALRWGNSNAGI